jgi:uncharacterized RDD family membrane protein YckC
MAGRLIDWVALSIFGWVGGLIAAFGLGAAGGMRALGALGRTTSFADIAISIVISSMGSIGYHVLGEGIGGVSVGKLVLGLRVRSADLSPCRIRGALIRTLAVYWDGILFGLVAYGEMANSEMQQRCGDKWGDTVVVKAASLPRDPEAGLRVALGLGFGSAVGVLAGTVGIIVRAMT